jgi:hypothetical protein
VTEASHVAALWESREPSDENAIHCPPQVLARHAERGGHVGLRCLTAARSRQEHTARDSGILPWVETSGRPDGPAAGL